MTELVFISHSSRNAADADALAGYLRGLGIEPWLASEQVVPGSYYAGTIHEAILKSDAVILLLTPAALASSQVKREIDTAISVHRPAFPWTWRVACRSAFYLLTGGRAAPAAVVGAQGLADDRVDGCSVPSPQDGLRYCAQQCAIARLRAGWSASGNRDRRQCTRRHQSVHRGLWIAR